MPCPLGTLGRMSDQTPENDQPTPPPTDEVSDTAGQGATPPPPPSEADAEPTPAPRAKKSKIKIAVAAVAALLLVAVAAVVVVLVVNGEKEHTLTATSTAGGMERDTAKEKELAQQLEAAEEQFKSQFTDVSYVKSGVYNQDDADRGPKGALVFLGAKLEEPSTPGAFLKKFDKQASENGFEVTEVATGEGGGEAICASQDASQKVAICAWATEDSRGELVPTVPGYDAETLAKIMLDVRADVETTD